MREPFTPEYLREALSYDPDTGIFIRKERPLHHFNRINEQKLSNRYFAGKIATVDRSHGYLNIKLRGVSMRASRVAWAIYYGEWPKQLIDHINGNPKDNRIANLRDVSSAENMKNRKLTKRNTTGVIGVRKKGNRFAVQIAVDGKFKHLGLYKTIEEAAAVRRAANAQYGYSERHGEAA